MPGKVQLFHHMRTIIAPCLATLCLCACSLGSDDIDITGNKNAMEAIDAAAGPLEDLNIRKREIPPILIKAAANPYAQPKKATCDSVLSELTQLDALLGEDIKPKEIEVASADGSFISMPNVEMPDMPDTDGIMSGAKSLLHDKILDTIRDRANIIPLRGIVRKITGAARHQREMAEAYEAGKMRRAYLKGFTMERFGKRCLDRPAKAAKAEAVTATNEETSK